MSTTENTHLKNATPSAIDSNPSVEIGILNSNTYQRSFLIVTGSLLPLLVWIAVADKSRGHYLKSSTYETAKGAVALVDNQVDSTNIALTKDFSGLDAVSENDEGKIQNRMKKLI